MNGTTIEKAKLAGILAELFDEAFKGSTGKGYTWFTDDEPAGGFIGVLESLDAAAASRPFREGSSLSPAAHAEHLRFALANGNRMARGEPLYKAGDWARSWEVRRVSETEWREILAGLRAEYATFRELIASGKGWEDEQVLTGVIATVAHGAWHLGAIRQGLGLVRAPGE